MKMNIFKSLLRAAGFLLIPACITMSSCSEDIDESDLYTFTGETIEDFISNNSEQFSSFNYILTRSGYDRILSTYGSGCPIVPRIPEIDFISDMSIYFI